MASNSIKEFCETYIKYKNWEEPEGFNPNVRKPYFTLTSNTGLYSNHHLELDDEDIKILYEKYSGKLLDELEENIQQIKATYGEIIKNDENEL